ncbi:MAG: hypothetical protein HYZ53_20255 [Planctomycetes bacterium]|nr:hypothetical protein [Planctomycetota bacterium]
MMGIALRKGRAVLVTGFSLGLFAASVGLAGEPTSFGGGSAFPEETPGVSDLPEPVAAKPPDSDSGLRFTPESLLRELDSTARPVGVRLLALTARNEPGLLPAVAPALKQRANGEDPGQRLRAVLLLAWSGDPAGEAYWSVAVRNEPSTAARAELAANAPLGADPERNARIQETLLESLQADPEPVVRGAALAALSNPLPMQLQSRLASLLFSERWSELRCAIVERLCRAEAVEPPVVDTLARIGLTEWQDREVRLAALRALASLAAKSSPSLRAETAAWVGPMLARVEAGNAR